MTSIKLTPYRRYAFIRILLALLSIYTLMACSIERFQPEGERLYTGIKSVEFVRADADSPEQEQAISKAQAQLEYAPNNSVFGSSSLRWPMPLFRPWLYLRYKGNSSFPSNWLHQLGSKPIWLSDVSPNARVQVAARILREYGYLRATGKATEVITSKDSLRASVSYSLHLGNPFLYDSIKYLPPIPLEGGEVFDHQRESVLRSGNQFSLSSLQADRALVQDRLRNHGYYYFSGEHLSYEADTLQHRGKVQLRSNLKRDSNNMRQWHIGQIQVRILDPQELGEQRSLTQSLSIAPNIGVVYNGGLPVRQRVLNTRIRLRPDSLYRQQTEDIMLRSLSKLGAFSSIDFLYSPADSLSNSADSISRLNMTILLRPDKPLEASISGQLTRKSNDFIGPGISLGLDRRNIFGGGETLSASVSTSYEWQNNRTSVGSDNLDIHSYQLGGEVGLTFPTLLLPWRMNAYYPFPTSTTVKLTAQLLNRAKYYTMSSFGLGLTYDFTIGDVYQHRVTPLSINYTQLERVTDAFEQIITANPSIGLSMRSQLIPKMSYSFTYDNALKTNKAHRIWITTELSEAGNLINLSRSLVGADYNSTKKVLGVPYAQFVKLTSEMRYTYRIDRNQKLATRLSLGAIYSYGNSRTAPYVEQFYVGGANSIRAFTVRSLGPGSYNPTQTTAYSFMDRVGELKLEANAEYRGRLLGNLEGAVFMDAGNIWMLRRDDARIGGSIGEVKSIGNFLDQIAVGTGAGLRYDLSFLVIRFDVGIGLHLPYSTSRKGWYNIPRFKDAIGYHVAIGYPF